MQASREGEVSGAGPLAWSWLGRVRYRAAWELQEALRRARIAGTAPDTLLLLEHEPVITLGRSAEASHVLAASGELERRGIDCVKTSRGGDVTYHGPGQLVGYPIFAVRGVLHHVETMARALVAVVRSCGVEAEWRRSCPGLWVGDAKLASFGVHIHRRVAIHGFALNVTTALDAFSLIVPCGLAGARVTSLAALGAEPPSLERLAEQVAAAFGAAWRRAPQVLAASALPAP